MAATKLFGSEGLLLMEVEVIETEKDKIFVRGKMMGQIPMRIAIGPNDLREALQLLSFPLVWQVLRLLFKRTLTNERLAGT